MSSTLKDRVNGYQPVPTVSPPATFKPLQQQDEQIVKPEQPQKKDAAAEFIKVQEAAKGPDLHVYNDIAGRPTIGYGHLLKPGENLTTITKEKAEELLKDDIEEVNNVIDKHVKVSLSKEQRIAIASFVFNFGETKFRKSTLLQSLNRGDYKDAADELLRWNKAADPKTGQKVISKGLSARRERERELFLKGTRLPKQKVSQQRTPLI